MINARESGSVGQQRDGSGIFQNVTRLFIRERGIDARERGAGFQNGELAAVEELGSPGEKNRDYAFSGDERSKEAGEGRRLVFQFSISDQAAIRPSDSRRNIDGRSIRPLPRCSLEKLV